MIHNMRGAHQPNHHLQQCIMIRYDTVYYLHNIIQIHNNVVWNQHNIQQNIPHIQFGCEEYSTEYCQSHITMLCVKCYVIL
jgi:hypothetical protein